MRRLYYDTVLHDPATVDWLVQVVGADRLLVGTDYPFAMGDPDPLSTVASLAGLTEHDRALVRAGNARRLLATFAGEP